MKLSGGKKTKKKSKRKRKRRIAQRKDKKRKIFFDSVKKTKREPKDTKNDFF